MSREQGSDPDQAPSVLGLQAVQVLCQRKDAAAFETPNRHFTWP